MKVESIEVKNIKIAQHMSEETLAFTASLWVNGKRVGHLKNDGHGGATKIDLYIMKDGRPLPADYTFDDLDEYVKENHKDLEYSGIEFFLYSLICDEDERRENKKLCRKGTVIRKPGVKYEEGVYDAYEIPYSPGFAERLRKHFGGDIYILNEHI
jgi:hypothetical protein